MDEIVKEAKAFEDSEFSGPVAEKEVENASRELGIPFPPQYRVFLMTLGSGGISSESFIGLGGPQHLNVVWLTQSLRKKNIGYALPPELIPVRADGFGNYDCIDTSRPTSNGEYAIVEWLHDGGQKGKILAPDYFEWFRSILKMIREIES